MGEVAPQAHHLVGGLDRFGPGIAEQHAPREGGGDDALGEPLLLCNRIMVRDMDQGARLGGDRRAEPGMAVAEGVDGDPGEGVQVAAALGVNEMAALAADKGDRCALVVLDQEGTLAGCGHGGLHAREAPSLPMARRCKVARPASNTPSLLAEVGGGGYGGKL